MQVGYITACIAAAALCSILAAFIYRRRSAPGGREFFYLLVAAGWWSAAAALESIAGTLNAKIFWSVISYPGVTLVPVFFLLFTWKYTQQRHWFTEDNRRLILFFIFPVVTWFMAATNSLHRLLWPHISIQETILGLQGVYHHGLWWYLYLIYAYILLLAGIATLLNAALKWPKPYNNQAWIILASYALAMSVNMIYAFTPHDVLAFNDPTPLAISLSCLGVAWAIYRHRLLDLVPIGREVLFEQLPDAIILFDGQGRIIDANPAAVKMFSIKGNPAGTSLGDVMLKYPSLFEAVLCSDTPTEVAIDMGRPVWVQVKSIPLRSKLNKTNSRLAIMRDISEEKSYLDRISNLSYHDILTGLYNRTYFDEVSKKLDVPENLPLTLIMCDVNGLKLVNDVFGHRAGDQLLVAAARILTASCRQSDIIVRWGGDEFVILLPRTTGEDAVHIVERIKKACDAGADVPIKVYMAVGFATKREMNQDILFLMKEAETLMYEHKLQSAQLVHAEMQAFLRNRLLEAGGVENEAHFAHLRQLVFLMGRALNLSKNAIERLMLLADWHDIGNLSIAPEILNKPGSLSPEERALMQKHAEAGYRLLLGFPNLAPLAQYVYDHHERWDGSGYPRGIKEEDISLSARILALADAYDAMTRGRFYKPAVSREEALAEIERGAGSQFDPFLAELFVREVREKT